MGLSGPLKHWIAKMATVLKSFHKDFILSIHFPFKKHYGTLHLKSRKNVIKIKMREESTISTLLCIHNTRMLIVNNLRRLTDFQPINEDGTEV